MPVTSQEHLVRMGSGRQMDDDGVKPQVDILAMLDAASSQSANIASAATKAPRMSAPPGFDKPDAEHPHKGDKDPRISKKERGASRSPGAVERPGQVPGPVRGVFARALQVSETAEIGSEIGLGDKARRGDVFFPGGPRRCQGRRGGDDRFVAQRLARFA
jgi:hypothetical protein